MSEYEKTYRLELEIKYTHHQDLDLHSPEIERELYKLGSYLVHSEHLIPDQATFQIEDIHTRVMKL